MTRSLVFTNTSNWDGEDYRVTEDLGGAFCYKGGESCVEVTLKPGEQVVVYPKNGQKFIFRPVGSKGIEPFVMNGRQMTPTASVSFE